MERLSRGDPRHRAAAGMSAIDAWFVDHLACPRDHGALRAAGAGLVCEQGHEYPVEDGVPVMLRDDVAQTIEFVDASLRRANHRTAGDPRAPHLYLESLGMSDDEKRGVVALAQAGGPIDPVVAYLIAATGGLMYRDQIGVLDHYPIPPIRLPDGAGRLLLDVGCSWGRWTAAAAARGYRVVGIDPSLGAVMAARRVARALRIDATFVVGDARFLPFRAGLFDQAYSYSVIQHFSKPDAALAVGEMARVLQPGGSVKVQMPSALGIRCLYHQLRRGFREPTGFEVRYWSLPSLKDMFGRHLQAPRFEVDGFFGIGLQPSDAAMMSPALKAILGASEFLRSASRRVPLLVWGTDSVFVEAVKAR
jgi:SAM-dependent methyltransferase